VVIKGLTKEEVDPDFKGTDVEFATKYGHVNLHTKEQIEQNKQQEALMAWLGLLADLDRISRQLIATFGNVDAETLHQWITKPNKTEKFKAWHQNIETAFNLVALLKSKTP
jgi:hypothetical protein